MIDTVVKRSREKAILVGLEHEGVDKWELKESLEELAELALSAGAQVVGTVTQKLGQPTAPFYIGKGKAEHVAEQCQKEHVTSVIFDDELSPAQGRNLEKLTSRKVLDRTQLILDIFAQRARSREGRLQIELAQLQYLLPRLTGMWTHLSRQSGGIGTRGPGETQLEVDRRRVQERIARLERDLREVRKHRSIQREGRRRHHWPVASLVGYTNAGKSTLLNRLTGAGVLAADQLFATLDPTTRQFMLPNNQKVLLTDTVGFIRKLPHTLVSSFRATLEEVERAEVLLHLRDASSPMMDEQKVQVEKVLGELEVRGKPVIEVLNKIDLLPELERARLGSGANGGTVVAVSALTKMGLDQLLAAIDAALVADPLVEARFRLPQSEGAALAALEAGAVLGEKSFGGNVVYLTARGPASLLERYRRFRERN